MFFFSQQHRYAAYHNELHTCFAWFLKAVLELANGNNYRQLYRAKLWRVLAICPILSGLWGCQSFSYKSLLDSQTVTSEVIQTSQFSHRVLRPTRQAEKEDDVLHIYIDGDGRPWRARYFVSSDPTPQYGLMLDAMLKDPYNSLYLGRPCYLHTEDEHCEAWDWTMARYSSDVVASMVSAVEQLSKNTKELWLIGHSGGGALAVLIGSRLTRSVNVVTIAGNLDHKTWTEHHKFSPLVDSLNPIDDLVGNKNMQELHWYGTDDGNVIPSIIVGYCDTKHVTCLSKKANHSSGWLLEWRSILFTSEKQFNKN